MKNTVWKDIIGLFTVTRLLLLLVTYIGFVLLTNRLETPVAVNVAEMGASWNHWDAANYVRIAQFGYDTYYDVAFFPLFPLLVHIVALPFGPYAYLPAGMLVSNAALLGAILVLYQLAADTLGDAVARKTILYLCIFPTALFFFAAYNEALFLFLTAGAFLALRRQRWWLAGIAGFLAALTRSAGVLLIFPYLYELWQTINYSSSSKKQILVRLLPTLLIPLGTGLYAYYCWQIRGNPLAFATVQPHWGRHLSWPWTGLWHDMTGVLWTYPFASPTQVHMLLDLSATLGFLVLIVLGARILRPSYTLWAALLMLTALLSPATDKPDLLLSNMRFVLELFPCFMTLAYYGTRHTRLHQVLILIFPMLLATLSLLFIMNRYIV